jgi:hypothetical protein
MSKRTCNLLALSIGSKNLTFDKNHIIHISSSLVTDRDHIYHYGSMAQLLSIESYMLYYCYIQIYQMDEHNIWFVYLKFEPVKEPFVILLLLFGRNSKCFTKIIKHFHRNIYMIPFTVQYDILASM